MILNSILSSPIQSIAFSKDDERLGVGLEDGILALLSPESNWEAVGEIDQSESCVSCQDWAPGMLACGRMNGSVTLFDTDKVFDNFFVPVAEFTSKYPVRSLTFGRNGNFIAIGGDNGAVSILSAQSGWQLFHRINVGYSILSIKWSPVGRYLGIASAGSDCSVYNTINWTRVKEVEESISSIFADDDETSISCLAWSVDSKWMAMGGLGSGVDILDTSTWTFLESSANVHAISAAKAEDETNKK